MVRVLTSVGEAVSSGVIKCTGDAHSVHQTRGWFVVPRMINCLVSTVISIRFLRLIASPILFYDSGGRCYISQHPIVSRSS